jgi:hypothetical protein
MSGWAYNWFAGRSGARRSDAPKKAILGLREQLEMLSKREKHLESQINDQDALARKHVSGNKTGEYRPVHVCIATTSLKMLTHYSAAKAALRRKKQYEHSLEQTQGQIMTLEREIYNIETANINKETLEAMKNAGKAMKEIHGGLTIDKVDQTMYVYSPCHHCTLTILQGRAPRATRHRRRNRRGHHTAVGHAGHRRRRARGRARGHAGGGASESLALDGARARQRQGWRLAHGSTSRFVPMSFNDQQS